MDWKALLWRFAYFCACLMFTGCETVVVVSPANAAIRIGDKLILNCSSSYDPPNLLWYKSSCFDCARQRIPTDFDLPSYQISRNNGGMADLIMPSVTMDMAGSYVCGNDDLGVSSDVIVLEADPECWISSTDVRQSEIVEMSCTVIYRGTWTPVMKWQRSDGKDVTGFMHSSSDNSGIRFTYTAAVKATDSLNGMHFQCVTNFDQQNSDTFTSDCSCDLCTYQLPLTICATGAPTYTYIWSSRPLSVSVDNVHSLREPSHNALRRKRQSSDSPLCAQTVSVGQQIVLGQRNRSCTWTVSTDTSPEHYVSTIDILVINPARLGDAGVYKCSSGQTLVLNCPVTVFFKPDLTEQNFCTAEEGQSLSCISNAPTSLQLHSRQTIFGICGISGNLYSTIKWMFCPNACIRSSADRCYPVSDNGSSSLAYFTQSKITKDASGLYFCQVDILDASAAVYNVCVSVSASDCAGTSVRWWRWYQAAVAIVTVDIIAAICFLVMVIVILIDNDSTITFCSRLLLIVLNHVILLILAAMMIIGCAICLSRDFESTAKKWETGVLVMFAFLFLFGLLSAIVTAIYRCKGNVHLYVVMIWDIVTILVALATLIWTLINMSQCRAVQTSRNSNEWSWEIFLIALAIAILVFGLMILLWYIRRKKHCKCCRGTNRWNCHFSMCCCCKHNDRERIKVGSASSRDTIDHSNHGNYRHDRYADTGCCFLACCKRKVGNDPELGSNEIKQTRHETIDRPRRTVNEEQTSSGYWHPRQRYSWICCGCKKRDHNSRLSDSEETVERGQRTASHERHQQHYSWVCCAPSSCHRRTRADKEHISKSDNIDEEDEEKIRGKHRNHRSKARAEIDDHERHHQRYTWKCCVCCGSNGRGNDNSLDRKRNRKSISEDDEHVAKVRQHYTWMCCGKHKPRDDHERRMHTHKDDDDDIRLSEPRGGRGRLCCLSCCHSNGPRDEDGLNRKKKQNDSKVGNKPGQHKDKNDKDKGKDQKKNDRPKSPKTKNGRNEEGSDNEDEENQRERKHGKHETDHPSDKEKERDEDSPQSVRKSDANTVNNPNKKKANGKEDNSDVEPDAHLSDEDVEKKRKKEINYYRGKLGQDFTLPPLLDSIELQENSSQGQAKRFMPPHRLLATSVLDDDRSLTPDTPGRSPTPEGLDISPKRSQRKLKKAKIMSDDLLDTKKKHIDSERL